MYNDLPHEDLLDAAQSVFRPENMTIALQYDPAQCGCDVNTLLNDMRESLT